MINNLMIDLSHTLETGMPVYPGTAKPIFELSETIAENGFQETKMIFQSHTGTHIDCPGHIFANGQTTDSMPIESFVGKGIAMDFGFKKEAEMIDKDEMIHLQQTITDNNIDFVIIHTGWYKNWGEELYYRKYPTITNSCAEWLSRMPIKGIGLDVISIDTLDDENLTNHKFVLSKNIIIIENLKDTEKLLNKIFTFVATPLKIKNGDGAPVRAFAMIK